MNDTARSAAAPQSAVFVTGSDSEDNKGKLLFRAVAESGGLSVFSPEPMYGDDGETVVRTFSYKAHDAMEPPTGSPRIWVGQDAPPDAGFQVWCRRAGSDGMNAEVAKAYADRDALGLTQVGILDIAAPATSNTFHLLIGADGVLRSFNRETDLYAHLVDDIAGVL